MKRISASLLLAASLSLTLAAQQATILGDTNFDHLIMGAPTMPASTAEALVRSYGPGYPTDQDPNAIDKIYAPINADIKNAHDRLSEKTAGLKDPGKDMMEKINASHTLDGMGGVENVKAEAMDKQNGQERLKQSAAASVGAMGGPCIQAVMQKVMNDPAYRASYNKMTQAQKQQEFSNCQSSVPDQTKNKQLQQSSDQFQSQMKTSANSSQELAKIAQELQTIQDNSKKRALEIQNSPGTHQQIKADADTKIRALPLVNMGELGMVHDPEAAKQIRKEQLLLDRNRAGWELNESSSNYSLTKSKIMGVVSEYQMWIKKYGGAPMAEKQGAQFESDLIDAANGLVGYTSSTTGEVASWERIYRQATDPHPATGTSKKAQRTSRQ